MIKIYYSNIINISYEKYIDLITPEIKTKVFRYKKNDDQKRAFGSEILLRTILINEYQISNETIAYQYGIHNKPYLKNKPNLYFNKSHSGDFAICVFNDTEIGIDIETKRPINAKLIKKVMNSQEITRLNHLNLTKDEIDNFFLKTWTIKESYLKMLGIGLINRLNEIKIDFEHQTVRLDDYQQAYFHIFEIENRDLVGSICCKDFHNKKIEIINIKL